MKNTRYWDWYQKNNQTMSNNGSNSQIINGRYKLIKPLERSEKGEVYLAWHLTANHQVTIKFLPKSLSDDEVAILELQQKYALLVDNLRHSHIVSYLDLDKDLQSGHFYLIMDHIEGQSLRHLLLKRNNAPLSLKDSVALLAPIAQALDYAHANRIIHCNIKPENIFIREKDQKVFLTNFGLSNKISQNLSDALPYMAPEQYRRQAPIAQTDTWALGVVLYELLAENPPYHEKSFEYYKQTICHKDPKIIPKLAPKAWAILKQMLAKDKRKRPLALSPLFKSLTKSHLSWKIRSLILFLIVGFGSVIYFKSGLIEEKTPPIKVIEQGSTNKQNSDLIIPKREGKVGVASYYIEVIEKNIKKELFKEAENYLNKLQDIDLNHPYLVRLKMALKKAKKEKISNYYTYLIEENIKMNRQDKVREYLDILHNLNTENLDLAILEKALKKADKEKEVNDYIDLIKKNIQINHFYQAREYLNKLYEINAKHPDFVILKASLKRAIIAKNKKERYIKVSPTGEMLPKSAKNWVCVFDTKTNLYWEVKTKTGVHNQKKKYYYNGERFPNWDILIDVSNNEEFCGFSDGWRIPLFSELRSILDYKRDSPAINNNYFPNTRNELYWTSSLNADARFNENIWVLNFKDGNNSSFSLKDKTFIRLVRSAGQ